MINYIKNHMEMKQIINEEIERKKSPVKYQVYYKKESF